MSVSSDRVVPVVLVRELYEKFCSESSVCF